MFVLINQLQILHFLSKNREGFYLSFFFFFFQIMMKHQIKLVKSVLEMVKLNVEIQLLYELYMNFFCVNVNVTHRNSVPQWNVNTLVNFFFVDGVFTVLFVFCHEIM